MSIEQDELDQFAGSDKIPGEVTDWPPEVYEKYQNALSMLSTKDNILKDTSRVLNNQRPSIWLKIRSFFRKS